MKSEEGNFETLKARLLFQNQKLKIENVVDGCKQIFSEYFFLFEHKFQVTLMFVMKVLS